MTEVIITDKGIVLVENGGREPARAPFRFDPETQEITFPVKDRRGRNGTSKIARIGLVDLVRSERLS